MARIMFRMSLCLVLYLTSAINSLKAQLSDSNVKVVGAMRNVMWKGELFGNIDLDTISDKKNLYGLGPVEYLSGELMIINGRSYKSTVGDDLSIKVEETYESSAPFFVYANVSIWTERAVPDSVQSLKQFEIYLDQHENSSKRPFAFFLEGIVESAKIHVVNLPEGATVSSPNDAHLGQMDYDLAIEDAIIVGFFSREHKTIFTHHDTFLHMHLMTTDKLKMGHLDDVNFKKGSMKLFLPFNFKY